MPAGDLITGDFQVELQGFLMGGSATNLLGPGDNSIKGLGTPGAKTADVELDGDDGAYGSPEYTSSRIISVPFWFNCDTAAAAMALLESANVAWAAVLAPVELHMQLPGWGHFHVVGRPRLLDENLDHMPQGVIYCLGTFAALDPALVGIGGS